MAAMFCQSVRAYFCQWQNQSNAVQRSGKIYSGLQALLCKASRSVSQREMRKCTSQRCFVFEFLISETPNCTCKLFCTTTKCNINITFQPMRMQVLPNSWTSKNLSLCSAHACTGSLFVQFVQIKRAGFLPTIVKSPRSKSAAGGGFAFSRSSLALDERPVNNQAAHFCAAIPSPLSSSPASSSPEREDFLCCRSAKSIFPPTRSRRIRTFSIPALTDFVVIAQKKAGQKSGHSAERTCRGWQFCPLPSCPQFS